MGANASVVHAMADAAMNATEKRMVVVIDLGFE